MKTPTRKPYLMNYDEIFRKGKKFGYEEGQLSEQKRILEWIENQRDNGNMQGGFSSALCLSQLMKDLEKSKIAETKK